jgi:hypothetical protein
VKPLHAVLLCLLLLPTAAAAQRRVTAPVDFGIGPSGFLLSGPVQRDQLLHTGVKLSLYAVLDREWLQRNQALVPRRYRGQLSKVDEVRFAPAIVALMPTALLISPRSRDTGMFGATWELLQVGLPLLSGPVRFGVNAGLVVTYAYLYSRTLPTTHFIRPGAEVGANLEFKLSRGFLISLGWDSAFYPPQRLGAFGFGSTRESIWHIGQPYLKLHFRFPYTTRI